MFEGRVLLESCVDSHVSKSEKLICGGFYLFFFLIIIFSLIIIFFRMFRVRHCVSRLIIITGEFLIADTSLKHLDQHVSYFQYFYLFIKKYLNIYICTYRY